MIMWNELGLSGGTAIIILIALYFVIKWAVKNGIKEAYSAITGKKTEEDVRNEKELKELGFELEDKFKFGELRKSGFIEFFCDLQLLVDRFTAWNGGMQTAKLLY